MEKKHTVLPFMTHVHARIGRPVLMRKVIVPWPEVIGIADRLEWIFYK
jgi:hypothetical protein